MKYYLQALSEILEDKDKYISACRTQMDEADALEKIRSKREKAEAALATDMAKIQALVRENAYISQDQQVYRRRFEEMSEQIERQKNTIAELQEVRYCTVQGQSEQSLQESKGKQGSAGSRWDDHRSGTAMAEGT